MGNSGGSGWRKGFWGETLVTILDSGPVRPKPVVLWRLLLKEIHMDPSTSNTYTPVSDWISSVVNSSYYWIDFWSEEIEMASQKCVSNILYSLCIYFTRKSNLNKPNRLWGEHFQKTTKTSACTGWNKNVEMIEKKKKRKSQTFQHAWTNVRCQVCALFRYKTENKRG